jgi:hypothetical protein
MSNKDDKLLEKDNTNYHGKRQDEKDRETIAGLKGVRCY